MKVYRMRITYDFFDDFMIHTDTYISDNKYDLLKLFLNSKKIYDNVYYKLELLEGNPILVSTESNEYY